MQPFDATWVRSRFPAFSVPALEGQAFFENAGGSYPCRPVVDRLHRFYAERKVQPYAPYAASELAGAEMDEARGRLAAMLGVAAHELSFGPSTSANAGAGLRGRRELCAPRPGSWARRDATSTCSAPEEVGRLVGALGRVLGT